jgi:quercetin dioxygenase-like cupin family protein
MISSASETNAPYVLVEVCEPEGCFTIGHVQPSRTELLQVLEGEVGFTSGGETFVAGPGESVVVGGAAPQFTAAAS